MLVAGYLGGEAPIVEGLGVWQITCAVRDMNCRSVSGHNLYYTEMRTGTVKNLIGVRSHVWMCGIPGAVRCGAMLSLNKNLNSAPVERWQTQGFISRAP